MCYQVRFDGLEFFSELSRGGPPGPVRRREETRGNARAKAVRLLSPRCSLPGAFHGRVWTLALARTGSVVTPTDAGAEPNPRSPRIGRAFSPGIRPTYAESEFRRAKERPDIHPEGGRAGCWMRNHVELFGMAIYGKVDLSEAIVR